MIEIKNKEMCCGCSACAAICPKNCISMVGDRFGFLYPTVDLEKCVNCGLCETCCPALNPKQSSETVSCQAFISFGKDDSIRRNSSSGGIFYLIAKYIIGQGGVVFGAVFDDDFHGVKHMAVESLDELERLMGSKYLQSDMGTSYTDVKQYLEMGRKVLFSGTPCQISGLKAFLKKDWPSLFLVDVVCHGVPSPAVWNDYMENFENKYFGKVVHVSFRNKENGWKNYLFSLKLDNGYTYSIDHFQDLYMRGFLQNYFLRFSCYDCIHKGIERESDMTLGDCWGIEKICSEFDDHKGTSLVIVTSEKGKQLFEAIEDETSYRRIEMECVLPFNRSIEVSAPTNEKREKFERDFRRKPIESLLKKYCAVTMMTKIKYKIKAFLK